MEQKRITNLDEGIMDILKGIYKTLGIDSIVESIEELQDTIRTLSTQLSEKAQYSELEKLKIAVGQIKERIDSTQGELQSLHIREESDYTTSIEHFMKLNNNIGSRFKKDDRLRYSLYNLLVYNKQEDYKVIDDLRMSSEYDKSTLDTIYNLEKEIKDFHKNQVDIINKKIGTTRLEYYNGKSYKDVIIYPNIGDEFNNKFHEEISIDKGDVISKIKILGYSFPNYKKKAEVMLKSR